MGISVKWGLEDLNVSGIIIHSVTTALKVTNREGVGMN